MSVQEIEYIEADEGEYLQLNQSDIMETHAAEDSEEHWEKSSIQQLLDIYLQNIDKFRNPKVRKKTVWIEISNVVGKSPDSCDKKFRNLKQTYIRLLKKKRRTGAASIKWPYFDIFEEIYNDNGQYHPEIEVKIKESNETLTKAFISIGKPKLDTSDHEHVTEHHDKSNLEEIRKKINRKRYAEFRKVTEEMRDRQRTVEAKLDRLIGIVEESNNIQRERNALFQQFLDKFNT